MELLHIHTVGVLEGKQRHRPLAYLQAHIPLQEQTLMVVQHLHLRREQN